MTSQAQDEAQEKQLSRYTYIGIGFLIGAKLTLVLAAIVLFMKYIVLSAVLGVMDACFIVGAIYMSMKAWNMSNKLEWSDEDKNIEAVERMLAKR